MLIILVILMFAVLIYLVQSYAAFLTFKMKNITFGKSMIYLILPFYSLLIHLLIAYKLLKNKEIKKSVKILGYSFTKYNIFLNILAGVILEEIVVFETYGQSKFISSKDTSVPKEKDKKEKSVLEKVLKKPINTATQVAPIYN